MIEVTENKDGSFTVEMSPDIAEELIKMGIIAAIEKSLSPPDHIPA